MYRFFFYHDSNENLEEKMCLLSQKSCKYKILMYLKKIFTIIYMHIYFFIIISILINNLFTLSKSRCHSAFGT